MTDREKLVEMIHHVCEGHAENLMQPYGVETLARYLIANGVKVQEWLDDQPTLDVEPVRHGRWENYPGHIYRRCSLCKVEWEKPRFNIRANYCPNCGAKMDAKEECE